MSEKLTKEELLKKAKKPGKDALKLHPFYKGKTEVVPKCAIRSFEDLGIWYTPGVAEPCRDIEKNPDKVFIHTNKGNHVAVVSDGSRVLGLGDIGPKAGLPVMEGKAVLFRYLGGVDAFPVCLDTTDPEEIIRTVKILEPSFGGINLEDISKPKCFEILDRLREEMEIPVWHDDQQGTATVELAGVLNALKIVGKNIEEVLISMIGAGAANFATQRLLRAAGVKPGNLIMCDSRGIIGTHRKDLEEESYKWELAKETNAEGREGDMIDGMRDTDLVIAASAPGPGTIPKEAVEAMVEDAVVFACANPVPEIWPWDAKEAGARIVATGRTDFPNQINNSLGFPGIFRGTLDVRARTITDEMCIAAAEELARTVEDKGLSEDYIVPTMEEWEVYPREAVAVAMKAVEQKVARRKLSEDELYEVAEEKIKRARDYVKSTMNLGFIKLPE